MAHYRTFLWLMLGALLSPLFGYTQTAETNGKRIFTEGVSNSGEKIVAILNGIEVPAAVLPCANCHGTNGQGNKEGGVAPSNLQWHVLTKPYEQIKPSGRVHGPYSISKLKRAIAMGVDPAGNELQAAMPRYQMSLKDMQDLTSYVKTLGVEKPHEKTDSTIAIGLLQPSVPTPTSKAVRQVVEAYVRHINSRGGIYQRKVSVQIIRPNENSEQHPLIYAPARKGWSTSKQQEQMKQEGTPWVGILDGAPARNVLDHPTHFYTSFTPQMQVEALLSTVGFDPQGAFYSEKEEASWLSSMSNEHLKLVKLSPDEEVKIPNEAAVWKSALYLGKPQHLKQVHAQLEAINAKCTLLIPEYIIEAERPVLTSGILSTIVVGKNALKEHYSGHGIQLFRQLSAQNNWPNTKPLLRFQVLASMMVLNEGLKKTGNELTKARLLVALETIKDFHTGLGAPVTFSKNRRLGNPGFYLLEKDKTSGKMTLSEQVTRGSFQQTAIDYEN